MWNERDYAHYRDVRPRFAAEFGFQAPPTYATLARSVPEGERFATSRAMLHHQKAVDENDKLNRGLEAHFSFVPTDFDDWLYLTQLNQARAVQLGVEWFRSLAPRCMGTLYWQFNDCWPVTSWAAIDGDAREKPLWYATRRFFADQLLTFQPGERGLNLVACNDSDTLWLGEVGVQRLGFSGEVQAEETVPFHVQPRTTAVIAELSGALAETPHPERELLLAQTGTHKATWFFLLDGALDYSEPKLEGRLEGDHLTLTAGTLVRDMALFVDRLGPDARIDDQLLTLLPGETRAFTLRGLGGVSLEELLSPPVFNCANRFGRARAIPETKASLGR